LRTVKLTIAYEGSLYSGWQIQPNATTIQEVLQKAVHEVTQENNNVIGAGRTDAGVHALGQVASFRTEKGIPLKKIKSAINRYLPKDIRILKTEEVNNTFHPIRDSKKKHYRYILALTENEHPLFLNRVWHVRKSLNIEAMKSASKYLIGKNDFSSFKASDGESIDSVREVYSVDIKEESFYLYDIAYVIDVTGNGFLKNMVRNIVGTLIDVGSTKITSGDFKQILDAKDRKKAGVCAPASGLYLVSVMY